MEGQGKYLLVRPFDSDGTAKTGKTTNIVQGISRCAVQHDGMDIAIGLQSRLQCQIIPFGRRTLH